MEDQRSHDEGGDARERAQRQLPRHQLSPSEATGATDHDGADRPESEGGRQGKRWGDVSEIVEGVGIRAHIARYRTGTGSAEREIAVEDGRCCPKSDQRSQPESAEKGASSVATDAGA